MHSCVAQWCTSCRKGGVANDFAGIAWGCIRYRSWCCLICILPPILLGHSGARVCPFMKLLCSCVPAAYSSVTPGKWQLLMRVVRKAACGRAYILTTALSRAGLLYVGCQSAGLRQSCCHRHCHTIPCHCTPSGLQHCYYGCSRVSGLAPHGGIGSGCCLLCGVSWCYDIGWLEICLSTAGGSCCSVDAALACKP